MLRFFRESRSFLDKGVESVIKGFGVNEVIGF